MSLPRGYVDPSSLAGRYPGTSNTPLPDTFVAPDLRARNDNLAVGGAALGGLALLGLGAWWVLRQPARKGSRSRGEK